MLEQYSRRGRKSSCGLLDDGDFVLGEIVEFVNEGVDLAVGGLDLAPVEGAVVGDGGGGELLVEVEHAPDEGDQTVVAGDVCGVVKVDGADGKLLDKLSEVAEETTTQFRADLFQEEVQHLAVEESDEVLQRFPLRQPPTPELLCGMVGSTAPIGLVQTDCSACYRTRLCHACGV